VKPLAREDLENGKRLLLISGRMPNHVKRKAPAAQVKESRKMKTGSSTDDFLLFVQTTYVASPVSVSFLP
jgi:hypothetical protein